MILDHIAATREQFIAVECQLRTRPGVQSASAGIDCRAYRSGAAVELWLEAEAVGRTVCWWLEARRDGSGWVVTAHVLENRDDGEDQYLHELEPREVRDQAALGEAIRSAASVLLETASAGRFIGDSR